MGAVWVATQMARTWIADIVVLATTPPLIVHLAAATSKMSPSSRTTGTRTVSQGIWAVGQMVSMLNAGFVAITRALASRVQRVQPNRTPQAVPSTTNPAFRIIGSQAATNQSRPVVMPTGRMFRCRYCGAGIYSEIDCPASEVCQFANVPAAPFFWDPSCTDGGLGCNADGIHEMCRFCAVRPFQDVSCPGQATAEEACTWPVMC